jgi:S-adenosylmethionine decarboxylase
MKGLHLTADLYRCRCEAHWLADAEKLQDWCASAARAAGLAPLGHAFLVTEDGGASGTLLMAGAHVCLHTWPLEKAATADVFVGNDLSDQSDRARSLMSAVVQRFQPEWTEQRSLDRGDD